MKASSVSAVTSIACPTRPHTPRNKPRRTGASGHRGSLTIVRPHTRTVIARLRAAGCVFAEDEAELLRSAARTSAQLALLVRRRARGEPLEVVLGWAEFNGMRTQVTAGVFVPRKRSEFLVQQAANLGRPGAVILDLCCGSGAIGAGLRQELGTAELHAADVDPAAVRCARKNLEPLGAHVHEGDLYDALPAVLRGRIELLVANAPYVPTGSIELMPPEAREHEPRVALDGGRDGVGIQRRVADDARQWLAPGGHLLIETGEEQAPRTAQAVAAGGLIPHVARDSARDATVIIGAKVR